VFSPLSLTETNFDLARALEPEIRILVAADALGVLHDVSATLQAMRARGRAVDHVVLSGAREPDASTGSNRAELEALGVATVSAVLARGDDRGIVSLVDRLLGACDQR
jgi:dethiobiotin synthetase